MKFRFRPYSLQFRHPFTIASGTRTTTEVVYVELEHDGVIGYGEAAMPPYVNENQESVIAFLSKLKLESFNNPMDIDGIVDYCGAVADGNHAAKASVDVALHDLAGKLRNKPLHRWWNIPADKTPFTCITIGMAAECEVIKKVTRLSLLVQRAYFE